MSMLRKHSRDLVAVFLLILISAVIYHEWFFTSSYLTWGDWGFYYPETQKQFFRIPSIWNNAFLGFLDVGLSFYPAVFLWGVFSQFWDFGIAERLTYLFPSMIFPLVCTYILMRSIFKSSVASFVGTIVYTYNTYFMLGRGGHLTLMSAFGLAPLALYFFIKSVQNRQLFDLLMTSFLLSIMSFFEFRSTYLTILLFGCYFLYFVFTTREKIGLTLIKKYYLLCLPIGILFLVNLYWILGLLFSKALVTNEIIGRAIFGNGLITILNAVTLFHPLWTGGAPVLFIIQKIPVYFWIIPVIAFLGYYFNRSHKLITFFAIVSLIGMFLTKQNDIPFTNVYEWLYYHFPGFNAYRESSKFYFYSALGFSILIAGFIDKAKTLEIFKTRKYLQWFLIIGVISLFLYNGKPVFTGESDTIFIPRTPPSDYLIVRDFLNSHPEQYRSLWVPMDSRWAVFTTDHPKISMADIKSANWKFLINRKETSINYTEGDQIIDMMKSPDFETLLKMSSIRYVFVPIKDSQDPFVGFFGKNIDDYIHQLDQIKSLKKLNIGTKEVQVYENSDYYPFIYLSSDKEGKIKIADSDFTMVNPTEYRYVLPQGQTQGYLNFTNTFNEGWQLTNEDFTWKNVLQNKQLVLSPEQHFVNFNMLNSFLLNGDSSAHRGTIYFRAQAYVWLGFVISVFIFGLLVLTLFGMLIKKGLRYATS